MATEIPTSAPRKSGKSLPRSVRLALPTSAINPFAVIVVMVGLRAEDYLVRPLASDFGLAFLVQKVFDPNYSTYHVCLNGRQSTCDCLGYARYGFCKHVLALEALVRAG
jgi:hypothetical protein